ncbi:PilW family protein [Salinibius halmophilus]|uniref:PilW family protein n=1 Tax=Salinibius halmophilus TaxID=1853216 RepID=UPI000E676714|nr:PilW family protein [Salinibius halmophilus]
MMRRQAGISLVELMIAMVIGLIIIGAAIGAFLSSRQSYSVQSELIRLQDNARFAIDTMQQSLRQTGFLGCNGAVTPGNTVINDGSLSPFLSEQTILSGGNNIAAATSFGLPLIANQDWVMVSYADVSEQCVVDSHDVTNAQVSCQATNPFVQGQLLLATDCKQSIIFQQSNAVNTSNPAAATARLLEHKNDTAAKPGNCTQGLGNPVSCTVAGNRYELARGSIIMALQRSRFVVANNDFNIPTLYQQELTTNAGELSVNNIELVEGVERMQLLFGLDLNGDGSQLAYLPINQIDTADYDDIVGVRVSLLLRSEQANLGDQTSLTFANETLSFNDGRLRRVYTAHIALRNRL